MIMNIPAQTKTAFLSGRLMYLDMSGDVRKQMFWFPTWSNTNQAVQLHKMDRGLKIQI